MANETSGRRDNRVPFRASTKTPNIMMLRRTRFLLIVCGILAFAVLGIKLFNVMIVHHDEYEKMAIDQQVRTTEITASRGAIYDTNGKILAMNASVDTIFISPAEIVKNKEDPQLIARELSEILDVDYDKILAMTKNTDRWYEVVKRKVEPEVSEKVRAFKKENNLTGVKIEPDTKRYYPYGNLAAHVIGFVGQDNNGLYGLEQRYDSYLTGSAGRIIRATDNRGTDMLFVNYEDYYDETKGDDMNLTIDATIQYYLEKHLQQAVEDYDVQNGAAAIAMDPNSGAILGMVSLGNFDLNDYQKVSDKDQEAIDAETNPDKKAEMLSAAQTKQWRNKALSDTYEPGSTFKIITLAMALEEGVVNENSSFYCGGSTNVLGRTDPLKCWKTTGHGSQNLTQAIQHSCNVALVQIGQLIGARTFYKYAEAFGFLNLTSNVDSNLTAKTGIDMSGESGSIWWSQNTFYDPENLSQLAAASFGQTFTITPLQLITAVSACVNGGYLMKPYVVKSIVNSDGEAVVSNSPTVVRQVVSEQTSATVRQILEQVVGDPVDGTGKNAYVAGYRIGGKTGTADKVGGGVIVSFVCFAPADDPQVMMLLTLDEPSKWTGTYVSGGNMVAPVASSVMGEILPYLGIEPSYTAEELVGADKTVPNVVGLSKDAAAERLSANGFSFRTVGSGDTVTDQTPAGGAIVPNSAEIILYLGAEKSTDKCIVPNVVGDSAATANQKIVNAGLIMGVSGATNASSSTVRAISQSIAAGTEVEAGTVVRVQFSDSSVRD